MSILSKLKINSERLLSEFNDLAEIGVTVGGGISRLALSNEDLEARAWFANRIEEAGLILHDDEVGNLSGILPSKAPGARTLLIGSHLDSVPNGGRYDGTIGVLAGLECLRTIREAGIELPLNLEVINFTDEEGCWQSFFGSMGLAGTLTAQHLNDAVQDNAAFRAALFRAGIHPAEVHKASRKPDSLAGYLELHIEQSDRLELAEQEIGIVNCVVGRSTYNFVFTGEAAHAATTNSANRRDALQGAAMFITQMHAMVRDSYPRGVVNCGNVLVKPGTFNVVPSEASLRVEVRHPDEQTLAEMEARLVRLSMECAHDFHVSVNSRRALHRPVALMSEAFMSEIARACQCHGLKSMQIESYAGHDAQILSHITPSAMIFIPSHQGISHNPKEYTNWQSVENGVQLLLQTILNIALH